MSATNLQLDLQRYVAKGFPADFDQRLAHPRVAGIDAWQTRYQMRLCPETTPPAAPA